MAGINAYDRLEYSRLDLPTLQERMIAPMYLQEQHDRAEEQLNATLSEAEKARMAAFQDPNSNAARVYQDYTTRLQQATDQLARNGIRGAGVKAAIGKIRADYNKDIAPILGAWEQQKKDTAALNELKAKDRTLIFADDPNQRQIDAYISRGNASYIPQGISGQQIASQVAAAAKPYSDWISQTKPELRGSGVPYKYFTMIQKGFSPQDVAGAMVMDGFTPEQATEGTMILRGIRDNVVRASGAYELFGNDPDSLNQVIQYANQGLSQAIGTRQFGTIADTYNEGLAQAALKARASGKAAKENFYPYLTPVNRVAVKEDLKAIEDLIKVSKEIPGIGETISYRELAKENPEILRGGRGLLDLDQKIVRGKDYVNQAKLIAHKYGIDPNLPFNDLMKQIEGLKNNQVSTSKEYRLAPGIAEPFTEGISKSLLQLPDEEIIIKPNGRALRARRLKDYIDEDTGRPKAGYEFRVKEGIGPAIYNSEAKEYLPLMLEKLDNNIQPDLEFVRDGYKDYLSEATKQITESLRNVPAEAIRQQYNMSKSDFIKNQANRLVSDQFAEHTMRILEAFGVRNKSIDLKGDI